jgi:hypothetical protein
MVRPVFEFFGIQFLEELYACAHLFIFFGAVVHSVLYTEALSVYIMRGVPVATEEVGHAS